MEKKNNSSSTSKRGNTAKREARREAKKEAKKYFFSASDVDRWGRYGLASPPASLSNKQQ